MDGCRCFQPMRAGGPGTLSLAQVPAQVRVQHSRAKPSMTLMYSYTTWDIDK